MSLMLWTFWTYSFFGYLLEKGYAAATHGSQRARKGFLLLPMCPVYGLGALAVLALPPKYRQVVVLYYYRDCSTGEIAQMLGVPQGTVSVRLKRARERLKPMLKEWYDEEG